MWTGIFWCGISQKGEGESLQELETYFQQIWNETACKIKGGRKKRIVQIFLCQKKHRMAVRVQKSNSKKLKYCEWNTECWKWNYRTRHRKNFKVRKTVPVFRNALRFPERKNTPILKITVPGRRIPFRRIKLRLSIMEPMQVQKTPLVLQTICYLAQNAENVTIQTPYVICNGYMYDTLNEIASHAQLKIILNAVEKGSQSLGLHRLPESKKRKFWIPVPMSMSWWTRFQFTPKQSCLMTDSLSLDPITWTWEVLIWIRN